MAQFVHCSPLVQATNTGPVLLKLIIKLHYNWAYPFLRPSVLEVVKSYGEKWPYSGANTAMAATPPRRHGWCRAESGPGGGVKNGSWVEGVVDEEGNQR